MSTLGSKIIKLNLVKKEEVGKLGKYLDWKNLLQGLFNAEEDHKLYRSNIIYITNFRRCNIR